MLIPAKAEGQKIPGSSKNNLLSRFAENAFWLGRYVERAENLARLVAVTERAASGNNDTQAWVSLLETFQDREAFEKTGKQITGLSVSRWYMVDRDNPNSMVSALGFARENARALRHLISIEIWRQLNMVYNRVSLLTPRKITLAKLSDLCEDIRLDCQTHFGVVDTTAYRDEAWLFHKLGSELERADQTTRLMDIKYYQLMTAEAEGRFADRAWWDLLLRSASGYHAFRRLHRLDAEPSDAANFLLFDSDFPRSVRLNVLQVFSRLDELETDYGARPGQSLTVARTKLASRMNTRPDRLVGKGLHTYLDEVQRELITFSSEVARRYFGPE